MNNRILSKTILVAALAMPLHSGAQTYDANAAFQANELGATETSSLFDVFRVGYLDRLVPNSFVSFSADEHTNSFAGNANTQGFLTPNNVIVPAAAVNVSSVPFSGAFGLDAGEIFLHPGGRGPDGFAPPLFDGVLRFTAPTTAYYNIAGAFRSLDGGVTLNTIFRNGVSQVSITDAGPFNLSLQLAAGDVIDFASGAGSDGIGGDSTGLRATLTIAPPPPPMRRVNIDFNGLRPGDASSAGTYIGIGAAGGGTVFNGLAADSTGGNDNLTVSGSGLLDDVGGATPVAFSISPVGGDNEPSQPFEPASLYDDYIFNNSAGNNSPTGSPFSISGLTGVSTADLYFYLNGFNSGTITINGFAGSAAPGIYNGLNAAAFLNVPVVDGNITGIFSANGATGVMGGLTVAYVPEPGTAALLGFGALAALRRRRQIA